MKIVNKLCGIDHKTLLEHNFYIIEMTFNYEASFHLMLLISRTIFKS